MFGRNPPSTCFPRDSCRVFLALKITGAARRKARANSSGMPTPAETTGKIRKIYCTSKAATRTENLVRMAFIDLRAGRCIVFYPQKNHKY
jgi:hypothetical protein